MIRPFTTERLLLRPFEADDLAPLQELYGDAELMRYVTGQPRTLEETSGRLKKHMADYHERGFGLYAALDRRTGEMIGRCGLVPWSEGPWLAEVAWMFRQSYWGRGLATEFGRAMLAEAFGPLGLDFLFARAYPENLGSIAVMKKLGMRPVPHPTEVRYEIRANDSH